ncbi:TPA: Fic family protein [Vibrio diabolicus]
MELLSFEEIKVSDWIAILGIVAPIFISIIVYLWKKISKPKAVIFFEEVDKSISEVNDQIYMSNLLDKRGRTSVAKILLAHKTMFKNQPFAAGSFRTVSVCLHTFDFNDLQGLYPLKTNTGKSPEIHSSLERIVKMWNNYAQESLSMSEKSKVDLLARFHTYFLSIHPFEDGNGRFVRALLSEQLSFLFDRFIDFQPNIDEYHQAIFSAVRGDERQLKLLIVKESNSMQKIT